MKNAIFAVAVITATLLTATAQAGETCKVFNNGTRAICADGERDVDPAAKGKYACQAFYQFPRKMSTGLFVMNPPKQVGEFSYVVSNEEMQKFRRLRDSEREIFLRDRNKYPVLAALTDISNLHCKVAAEKQKLNFNEKNCQAVCNGIEL